MKNSPRQDWKPFCFGIVFGALLLVPSPRAKALEAESISVTFPAKPDRTSFYVDEAGLIGPSEGKAINEIAANVLKEEKIPILVVTVTSLMAHNAAGYTIDRYARELFDSWGIGTQERNYGMLLVVSKGDRKARIELGFEWKGSRNIEAQKVMETLIIPEFKAGNYSQGILAGVRGMEAMARGLALPAPKRPWWVPLVAIGFLVLAVGTIISLFKNGHKGWGWALIAGLGVMLLLLLRASARSGGSGGAFGGGSGGGGGATGSW
jgi:uncharacterized protein